MLSDMEAPKETPAPASEQSRPPAPPFRSLKRLLVQLAVLFVLYVLSTGPMYWWIFEAYYLGGSQFLAQLYYPLVIACEMSDTIGAFFEWYVGLWVL